MLFSEKRMMLAQTGIVLSLFNKVLFFVKKKK